MMRFLVDAQLPPALAKWLSVRGHRAEHVFNLGPREMDDDVVWSLAIQHAEALITKDEDFLHIRRRSKDGPAVVWLRIDNATNPVLFTWLDHRLDAILQDIQSGLTTIVVK